MVVGTRNLPPAYSRRAWLQCVGLLSGWALMAPALARAQMPPRLLILPLGPALSNDDVEFVKQALQTFYDFALVVGTREPLPRSAYYAPRQRYRADKLLDHLQSRLPQGFERVLGLTSVNISTTKGSIFDWGILGLGTIDGRTCVLSSYRCQRKLKRRGDARIRLGKVAVHEVGHTLGLEHCPTLGCLMQDAEGSVATVDDEADLLRKVP